MKGKLVKKGTGKPTGLKGKLVLPKSKPYPSKKKAYV